MSAAGPVIASPRRAEETIRPPCTLVIFGASGDLTRRLLAPAIAHLNRDGALSPDFAIVGLGRTPFTDGDFRAHLEGGAREFTSAKEGRPGDLPSIARYLSGDFEDRDLYRKLRATLEAIEKARGGPRNRIFYLATPPEADETIVAYDPTHHRRAGLNYITVATGRDFADVTSTSGVFSGTATGKLHWSKQASTLEEVAEAAA